MAKVRKRWYLAGFSTVFLTMILGSMVAMTFAFVQVAGLKATDSICDSVFRLAGLSILGEYDIDLYENYGILALGRNEEEIEGLIRQYGNATFQNKRPLDLIRGDIQCIEVGVNQYSLMDVERFQEELSDIMTFRLAHDLLKGGEKSIQERERPERELKNEKIIQLLPSEGSERRSVLLQVILNIEPDQLSGIIRKSHLHFKTNEYIKAYFNNNKELKNGKNPSFFRNEIEYILYGHLADEKNRKQFLDDFTAVRVGLNLFHIYQDTVKMEELAVMANGLTPGPGAVITQGLLASAWALSEAINDRKIIDSGGQVPILKEANNWALHIENLHRQEGGILYPSVQEGKKYEEYLEIFLYLAENRTKLLRVMDLIQINMIQNYNRDFRMSSRYKGFDFTATVNGKAYYFEKNYK